MGIISHFSFRIQVFQNFCVFIGIGSVLLRKNKNPILIYGVTNAAELIDAMMLVETPAPTANPADTSGL